MNTKTCYQYDGETKCYVGEGMSQESPLEPGVFLLPANATFTAPPAISENETALWKDGAWEIIPDYRGGVYWDREKNKQEIKEAGITPAADWTTEEPFHYACEWSDETQGWIVPLSARKSEKIARLRGEAEKIRMALRKDYSELEISTWSHQESGACLLSADAGSQEANAVFVRDMASARGMEAPVLAAKILNVSHTYNEGVSALVIKLKALEDKVNAAGSEEELDDIQWPA